jgi:hypothetical protein
MKPAHRIGICLALVTGGALAADPFDGLAPLQCAAQQGHDCLPGANQCSPLEPQSKRPPVIEIDFANKRVRSPYRTAVLQAAHATSNSESLILQGTDLLFAWSAVINKKTGALTISIADRKGAYIVFGQCRSE